MVVSLFPVHVFYFKSKKTPADHRHLQVPEADRVDETFTETAIRASRDKKLYLHHFPTMKSRSPIGQLK